MRIKFNKKKINEQGLNGKIESSQKKKLKIK